MNTPHYSPMQKVLVFGTFDPLHDGHRVFLTWARAQGKTLTVAVAHNDAVLTLKGRKPLLDHNKRCASLLKSGLADEAVVGDKIPGTWETLMRIVPDVVALGYDQNALKNALENIKRDRSFSFEVRVCPFAHEPERLHSSKIRCA